MMEIVTIIKVNLDLTEREFNAANLNLIRPHSRDADVIVVVIIIIIVITTILAFILIIIMVY